jgi:hypothetical protein
MMNAEMMKQMPHMMSGAGHMMTRPVATGAMMAGAGLAAGRGLLGTGLLRNPLLLLAGGVAAGLAAGYVAFKYEKEIIEGLSKLTGMGRDLVLEQKENLADLVAEAKEKASGEAAPAAPAATPADGEAAG